MQNKAESIKAQIRNIFLFLSLIATPILLSGFLLSCSDDDITASPDNYLVDFPQGNNPYDMEIREIYEKYGTQMLYRFNDAMFRWQVTGRLDYISTEGDERYVAEAVAFIKHNCLDFYSDDSLKLMLPYRIYLAKKLSRIFSYSGNNISGSHVSYTDTIPGIAAVNGYCNICFGCANNRLAGLSEDSLQLVKGELNASLIAYGLEQGIFKVPDTFTKLEFSNVNWSNFVGAGGYNTFGLLEYIDAKSMTPEQDFTLFLKYLIAYPTDKFEARFTVSAFDTSGRIAQKAKIVREWMQSEYGIDLVLFADKKVIK